MRGSIGLQGGMPGYGYWLREVRLYHIVYYRLYSKYLTYCSLLSPDSHWQENLNILRLAARKFKYVTVYKKSKFRHVEAKIHFIFSPFSSFASSLSGKS